MSSSAGSAGAERAPAGGAVIPVICGPTASGKSGIAMWLAARYSVTLISADSRQVFRGFDIGTAKPSRADRERVPHRGIDVVDPTERFSAAAFAELADAAIREARATGRVPLVVGGTGFYLSALFNPLWQQPEMDPDRRAAVQDGLEAMETNELRRWCEALDPSRAHLGRAQLLRAIEVALLTGERLSNLHVTRARKAAWNASYLLVDPGSTLQFQIAARTSAMFEAGWPTEVGRLMAEVPEDAPAWNATGYDAIRRLLRGEFGNTDAMERVIIETRQYAKRQRTWFRHQLAEQEITRVSPTERGWQEKVDRWMSTITRALEDSMHSTQQSTA